MGATVPERVRLRQLEKRVADLENLVSELEKRVENAEESAKNAYREAAAWHTPIGGGGYSVDMTDPLR